MPYLFIYLIKLSVSLSVVFLFYHFVLRKLTFYNHNRWYLLGYTLLSFFIPFINISSVLEKNNWNTNEVVSWIPVIHTTSGAGLPDNTHSGITMWTVLILILATGMGIMLLRLLLQLLSFHRMVKKALPVNTEGMNLYQVNENIIPFSFGNSIFINRNLHNEKELEEIIRHEFVHVKQKHSLDIIWAELLCLVNWFNPFAWLLKRSIRQNLEFIADHKVLENGINRKEYQYLLLNVIGNNQYSIATQFNFSSLKKRIAMMNKLRSAKVHLLKFLFLLPVAVVMLLAFRSKYDDRFIPAGRNSVTDTLPARPKLPDAIASIGLLEGKNDQVPIDPVKHKLVGKVTVKRKDGAIEMYDLNSDKSRDDFEKKYGARLEDLILPPPPPPPPPPPTPPPPPKLPEGVADMSLNGGNIITVTRDDGTKERFDMNKEKEKKIFEQKYGKFPATPKSYAPVAIGGENSLSTISSEYEITDKKAEIKLKDGTVEKYDLTNKQERAAFENKYGKIINVNTNVNATVAVTPVAVTVDGNTIVSPVTATKVSPTPLTTTVIAPVRTTGSLSAISVTPAALRSPVSGTTVIAPMAAQEGVTVIDDYGYTITGNEDILITITNNTTRQQLDDYIKQMKAKDIELTYDNIEFNSKGQLIALSGTMRSKDGRSNFVASKFEKLILAMIRKGEKTWFKVSVKDKEVI